MRRLLFWPPSMVYISVNITNHTGPSVWAAIHVLQSGHFFGYSSWCNSLTLLSWSYCQCSSCLQEKKTFSKINESPRASYLAHLTKISSLTLSLCIAYFLLNFSLPEISAMISLFVLYQRSYCEKVYFHSEFHLLEKIPLFCFSILLQIKQISTCLCWIFRPVNRYFALCYMVFASFLLLCFILRQKEENELKKNHLW